FFHKLKQYRHLFSRFDKLARNFLSFLYLVSAPFWLK
ncbi:transposase, partial [Thermostichus sp. OS-CIW-29]